MTHVGEKKEIVPEKLEKQCVWEEISFAKKKTVWSIAKEAYYEYNSHTSGIIFPRGHLSDPVTVICL